MGNVTQRTGFINDPFFNRTIYPIENVVTASSFQYDIVNGSGSAVASPLSQTLSQYTALALNNDGQNTRYLYGVKSDGTEVDLGMYNVPFKRSGFVVTSETKVDNPSAFVLEKQDESGYLVFSNGTAINSGVIYNFTAPQGD